MGLYLNWFKSYDTNAKKHKNVRNAKNGKKKNYTNNKFFYKIEKHRK